MASKGDSQASQQWETAATVSMGLNVADRLFSLIRAASQDDVQPQAARALENLGARCLVSADLISQGIDALGGNQSIRIRDTKISIGLSAGGIAAEFRKSTSCIQVFLLITALEACGYSEVEISEVIYCMLSETDTLRNSPTSTRQIQAAVKVLSGNSTSLISDSAAIAVDQTIHALDALRSLHPNGSTAVCWSKISHERFAEILVKAFDHLQDDNIHYVEISGSVSLVWIFLTLFWLNKDKVALYHGNKRLLGAKTSKIRIKATLQNTEAVETQPYHSNERDWEFKSWVTGEPITQMVKSQDQTIPIGEINLPGFIPSSLTHAYDSSRFRFEGATEVLRVVAEAYVAAGLKTKIKPFEAVEIPEGENLFGPLSSAMQIDSIKELLGPESRLFTRLGWTSKATLRSKIATLVGKDISNWAPDRVSDLFPSFRSRRNSIAKHLQKCFESCRQFITDPDISDLHEAAMSIAAHALNCLFLRVSTNGTPATKSDMQPTGSNTVPVFYEFGTHAAFWETIFGLPSYTHESDRAVNISRLREAIFKTAIGTRSRVSDSEATIASSGFGRSAIITPIFDHSIKKAGILDIYLIPGSFRFKDIRIDSIIEDLETREQTALPRLDSTGKVWKTIHHFSVEGHILLMRTSLECKASLKSSQPDHDQWSVQYTSCISEIAGSVQTNDSKGDSTALHQWEQYTGDLSRMEESMWNMLKGRLLPILDVNDIATRRQRRLIRIIPGKVPPFDICIVNSSVTAEVLFFSCQTGYFSTKFLIIQEDAELKVWNEKIFRILRRLLLSPANVETFFKIGSEVISETSMFPLTERSVQSLQYLSLQNTSTERVSGRLLMLPNLQVDWPELDEKVAEVQLLDNLPSWSILDPT